MNLLHQGLTCNINANQLYEQSLKEGITNFEEYPEWIEEKINEATVSLSTNNT